jgi:hypothetical protein
MNRIIKKMQLRLTNKKMNQWFWFIGLWLTGFTLFFLLALPFKLLIKMM